MEEREPGRVGDGSAVYVPAVADVHDDYFARFVVYLVDRPVVTYPDPPAFLPPEFARPRRTRFIREGLKTSLDTVLDVRRKPG
jgi:hypothetical protein